MASTFSKWAALEKFEDRSIGWNDDTNYDTIDAGISGNIVVMTNTKGSTINAFSPVKLNSGGVGLNFTTAILASTSTPCFGIVLQDTPNNGQGQVLTRGIIENPAWTWNAGDIIYLSSSGSGGTGDLVSRASNTHIAVHAGNSMLYCRQALGIALSATRVYFDINRFKPEWPYVVFPNGRVTVTGSWTESIKDVGGGGAPGFQHVLTSGGAASIDFTFACPPWFIGVPDIAGVWGFRIRYRVASGTIDVTNIYDGFNHSGDPGVATGNSTTWASFDVDWDKFNDLTFTPTVAGQVIVRVAVSAINADIEITPRFRFESLPTAMFF